VDEDEQKLEYTNVYNKFLKLFESKLEELLKEQNVTAKDFYLECRRLSEEEDDNEIVDFILALSDYQVFYNMMKEVKSRKLKQ